jgi:FKBP-type peptidyl-prolyl cis-trans isomerase
MVAVLGALALTSTACSSSTSTAADPSAAVAVSGTFGKAPTVSIPSASPTSSLSVKTLISGSGPVVTDSDAFVVDFIAYTWAGSTHKLLESTYTSSPQVFYGGEMMPGLDDSLVGKTIGSRVLAVIPPADAYGSQGDSQAGISGTDSLVFVVDLLKSFPGDAAVSGTQVSAGAGLPTVSTGTAPTITIPDSAAPASMVTKTLITGTGPKVASGDYIIVQYTGVIWRTKKVFDSSWARKEPFGLEIDEPEGVIAGWDLGLTGQTVGSRVLLVIPPKDGYGSAGNSEGGIKGTDTLVFVVDILGIVNNS